MSICKAYGVFPYALYANCIPIDAEIYAGKYRKRAVETNSTALLFICFNINFYDVLNIALQNKDKFLELLGENVESDDDYANGKFHTFINDVLDENKYLEYKTSQYCDFVFITDKLYCALFG